MIEKTCWCAQTHMEDGGGEEWCSCTLKYVKDQGPGFTAALATVSFTTKNVGHQTNKWGQPTIITLDIDLIDDFLFANVIFAIHHIWVDSREIALSHSYAATIYTCSGPFFFLYLVGHCWDRKRAMVSSSRKQSVSGGPKSWTRKGTHMDHEMYWVRRPSPSRFRKRIAG
jgi:hypothetical protein